MPTRVAAHLNLAALQHNLNVIKQLAPRSRILAMVKSNCYGHGFQYIVPALQAADGFGVADICEALTLRKLGIKQKIILMAGVLTADELAVVADQQFEIVVHTSAQIELLAHFKARQQISVWLKIDIGMHRLGFTQQDLDAAYRRLITCKAIKKPIHFITHLADAHLLDRPTTPGQIAHFHKLTQSFEGEKSIANSAGILAWPQSHSDWVRPGIMLYGVSPFSNKTAINHDLKPVMTLTSHLIAIHQLKKGDAIGYGGIWHCPEDMPVGVIAIGYGDGYPRHAENGTPILVNQTICPLVGRVSMDMITVDLRNNLSAKVGDKVVLWGEGIPIEKVATHANTIGYELLTRVLPRTAAVC